MESVHAHWPTNGAMAFSLFVESLNLTMRSKQKPVHLHQPYVGDTSENAG
jgi:hypothetical protein